MSSSMFSNINAIEINGGVFSMENHILSTCDPPSLATQKADLERLHPSHKADYRTILGDRLKREECTAGTRVKILQVITNWADDSSSESPRVFWLTGPAGSGKTTIAYTITKRFGKRGNADPLRTILGGNFLCSRQFEETRENTRIVPTIAYQLARKSKLYAGALHNVEFFDAVHHDVPTQLMDLLVGPWQQSSRSTELPLYLIVIDALDEINDDGGSGFLRDLLTVIDECNLRGFKFLVTSRPNPEVVTLCKSLTSEAMCWLQDVPIEEVELDIGTYLRTRLPKLASSPELDELVRQADGLFIYAATAVKYLTPRSITSREQNKMLKNLVSKSYKPASASDATFLIDALYQQIMVDAFSRFKDEFLTSRLRILYTFLCTAERISTSIVAALVEEDDDDVALAVVEDLHAVLYIQGDRVFWYHSSFPDFIFDPARSNFDNFAYWCDGPAHHNLLGESCFRVMKSGLRFNMGDIKSSFQFDSDHAEALAERVNNNISAVLRFSICHWTHHLPSPDLTNTDHLRLCISEFLQTRVLFWIEAMNLIKLPNQCSPMLQHAREWVLKCENNYSELARDIGEAANFATYFTGSPAAKSTPHLYISAVATWRDTDLHRRWKKQFSRIPVFNYTKGRNNVPLMTIVAGAEVNAVALSRDGMRIVSGSIDSTVRVWDASGVQLNVLKGHTNSVASVAFSRDGARIVSGSHDKNVRVWDVSTGAELKVLKGHTDRINSTTFSRDGMQIVSGSTDMTVRVWNAAMGVELNVLKDLTSSVTSVAFSRDGKRIVFGSDDKTVRVWDLSMGAVLNVLKGHINKVNSVAFSRDGLQIVSGSTDMTVRVWDASTGAERRELKGHVNSVTSVAFSRDVKRIVSGSLDGTVRVWDVSTGAELNVVEGSGAVHSVSFSRDGMRIVSGSADRRVRVWDASVDAKLNLVKGHIGLVTSVAFSSDGLRIVSGSTDGAVRMWSVSTGAELSVLEGHSGQVYSVAFSSDGMRVVSGSTDMTVRVWDASTGGGLNVLEGHIRSVNLAAFSKDGMRIVSGSSDKTVRVWNTSTGAELNVLKGHTQGVCSVTFSGDDMRIVSGSYDKTVRVWDASTGAELHVLKGHIGPVNSVAFSWDGVRIVSGSYDKTVRVWDALTGTELNILQDHIGSVHSVAFSTDGMRIVSGSDDGTVRLWEASTGALLNVLKGHIGSVNSVAFSRDAMLIASGSEDRTVRVWDMSMCVEPKGHTDLNLSIAYSRQFPHLTHTNWIISSHESAHLMWVPQEAQVVDPPTILIISRRGFGIVDFRQSMIGDKWIGCYTP